MTIDDPLTALAVILVSAAAAQWVGGRLKLPSVIFLLGAGLALSPILDPDQVFGDLLFTGVALGVAVLLFEGAASLTWRDIGQAKAPVIRLVTVGALITWAVGSAITSAVVDVDFRLALLIGAILVVSGPTVVFPILRAVRPREPTSSIIRWEGILIDPVGAGVAIVVLDAMVDNSDLAQAFAQTITTFGSGLLVGLAVSALLITALAMRKIPDYLQVNLTLAAVVAAYAISNGIRPEAGLVAVTVMGLAFANQRIAPSAHIVEFSENLGGLILGVLFIVLGARVEIDSVIAYLPASLIIIAALLLVARPLAVLASTAGTGLPMPDRYFLMLMAPRGVVAAAVASLFADELDHNGIDPGPLVPIIFTVVLGTVLIVGVGAKPMAKKLRVAQAPANGVALVGGGRFAVQLADELAEYHIPAIHVGSTDRDERLAIEHGQMVYSGRLDRHEFLDTMNKLGIRHAIAMSGIDHLDSFALRQLAEVVGSENLYALGDPSRHDDVGTVRQVQPRLFLPSSITIGRLNELIRDGAGLRTIDAQGRTLVHPDGETQPGVGDTTDPSAEWVVVCSIDPSHDQADFADPKAEDGKLLIELGPIAREEPDEESDQSREPLSKH